MVSTTLAQINLPNPIDVVTGTVTKPLGWAWDKVADGIANWVLGAVEYFVNGIIEFLLASSRPNVEAAWFSGSDSPYASVRGVAVSLLLVFLLLGLIQGLLAGDAGGMIRRLAADLPAAIVGMIATTIVVGKLLDLTDALSQRVLSNTDGQAVHFLSGFGVTATQATQGFAAVLLGLVAVVAGLIVWVELMIRSVLVYILVALSPLSFAARVWPAARGVLRRTIELLLAVILSKLVICIAIAVGVAALGGAGTADASADVHADDTAASMGTLFVGTAILVMAAFAPFLVLKLIPWAEGAIVAQGVSRSPIRAAGSTMGTINQAQSLSRLSGGHSATIGPTTHSAGWALGRGAGSTTTGALLTGGAAAAVAGTGVAGKAIAARTDTAVETVREVSRPQSPAVESRDSRSQRRGQSVLDAEREGDVARDE